MNLLQACSRRIVTAKRSTPVTEIARLMREHHVGSVVVMGEQVPVRAVGIVTDRDIAIKAVARSLDTKTATVGQIMTQDPVVAEGSLGVHEAIELMREHGVRRLLVTGEDGTVRGIISFDDLLVLVAHELNSLAQLIASGILQEEKRKSR
jgi:CBS domain-containing protein